MSFLLDSDICSAHLRRPGSLFHRFVQHTGRLWISTITQVMRSSPCRGPLLLAGLLAAFSCCVLGARAKLGLWKQSHKTPKPRFWDELLLPTTPSSPGKRLNP